MDDKSNAVPARLDVERYRHHIAHLNLPPEREREMIAVLYSYLASWVDRASGHDPITLAAGDRLQLCNEGPIRPVVASERDYTPHHDDLSGTFTDVSGPEQGKR